MAGDLHVAYDAPEELRERAWATHLQRVPPDRPRYPGQPVGPSNPLIAQNLPVGFRDEITFDFSGCKHTARHFTEIEAVRFDKETGQQTVVGVWGVEICVECGVQVARECAHRTNEWKMDGALLVCANCGVDGT